MTDGAEYITALVLFALGFTLLVWAIQTHRLAFVGAAAAWSLGFGALAVTLIWNNVR